MSGPSGHGTAHLYYVEARSTSPLLSKPFSEHNGMFLTKDWQRVETKTIPNNVLVAATDITVPAPSSSWTPHAADHGLMNKEAAYALAVRFHVGANPFESICVETRLVEVKLDWSYSVEEVGVWEPLALFDQLRNVKSTPREGAAKEEQTEESPA